ncbi:hypothetical protein G6F46_013473 [Rhizopus delemar]|uniref:Uncharacterized protein n=2 Tax=Rhizopus TaxID=4842 RepID=A0A9P6YSD6_9FUNG|nr:hypothetical protein G6F55_013324 [Rhizopus delemar]KAG1533117.1 hypothetical protein G6F51_012778 [Rhizopus arrhizus]KAG1510291.1 hypothetical protein G6F52_010938 [Rhizopus delemar]KAG1534018.1 hypothetical protein G6F49_013434 [Rhizopus delemar]KAG1563721.1 hypothetical protein G6F50_011726 [Rhizopus delemar]
MNPANEQNIIGEEEPFSMNLDVYLMSLCQEQGREVALTALLDFLKSWEDCNVGPTNANYEIDGIRRTREEYASIVIDNIDTMLTVTGIEKEREREQNDNWEIEDDLELLNNVEGLIQNQYKQYLEVLGEIVRLQELKEMLGDQIASNVTHWAHFKFKRPNATSESITIYTAAKQISLKTVVPGYTLHRNLTKKIRQNDPWARIRDDSTGGPGICNPQNQNESVTQSQASED